MPVELLQFPVRALQVRVAGFKAPCVQKEEDVLSYSPSWSVKAAIVMIDLLHNKITASVVVRIIQCDSLTNKQSSLIVVTVIMWAHTLLS